MCSKSKSNGNGNGNGNGNSKSNGFPAEAGPTDVRGLLVGLALAGKGPTRHHQFRGVNTDAFPAKAGPTGCNPRLPCF
jgi:hypothetical protein